MPFTYTPYERDIQSTEDFQKAPVPDQLRSIAGFTDIVANDVAAGTKLDKSYVDDMTSTYHNKMFSHAQKRLDELGLRNEAVPFLNTGDAWEPEKDDTREILEAKEIVNVLQTLVTRRQKIGSEESAEPVKNIPDNGLLISSDAKYVNDNPDKAIHIPGFVSPINKSEDVYLNIIPGATKNYFRMRVRGEDKQFRDFSVQVNKSDPINDYATGKALETLAANVISSNNKDNFLNQTTRHALINAFGEPSREFSGKTSKFATVVGESLFDAVGAGISFAAGALKFGGLDPTGLSSKGLQAAGEFIDEAGPNTKKENVAETFTKSLIQGGVEMSLFSAKIQGVLKAAQAANLIKTGKILNASNLAIAGGTIKQIGMQQIDAEKYYENNFPTMPKEEAIDLARKETAIAAPLIFISEILSGKLLFPGSKSSIAKDFARSQLSKKGVAAIIAKGSLKGGVGEGLIEVFQEGVTAVAEDTIRGTSSLKDESGNVVEAVTQGEINLLKDNRFLAAFAGGLGGGANAGAVKAASIQGLNPIAFKEQLQKIAADENSPSDMKKSAELLLKKVEIREALVKQQEIREQAKPLLDERSALQEQEDSPEKEARVKEIDSELKDYYKSINSVKKPKVTEPAKTEEVQSTEDQPKSAEQTIFTLKDTEEVLTEDSNLHKKGTTVNNPDLIKSKLKKGDVVESISPGEKTRYLTFNGNYFIDADGNESGIIGMLADRGSSIRVIREEATQPTQEIAPTDDFATLTNGTKVAISPIPEDSTLPPIYKAKSLAAQDFFREAPSLFKEAKDPAHNANNQNSVKRNLDQLNKALEEEDLATIDKIYKAALNSKLRDRSINVPQVKVNYLNEINNRNTTEEATQPEATIQDEDVPTNLTEEDFGINEENTPTVNVEAEPDGSRNAATIELAEKTARVLTQSNNGFRNYSMFNRTLDDAIEVTENELSTLNNSIQNLPEEDAAEAYERIVELNDRLSEQYTEKAFLESLGQEIEDNPVDYNDPQNKADLVNHIASIISRKFGNNASVIDDILTQLEEVGERQSTEQPTPARTQEDINRGVKEQAKEVYFRKVLAEAALEMENEFSNTPIGLRDHAKILNNAAKRVLSKFKNVTGRLYNAILDFLAESFAKIAGAASLKNFTWDHGTLIQINTEGRTGRSSLPFGRGKAQENLYSAKAGIEQFAGNKYDERKVKRTDLHSILKDRHGKFSKLFSHLLKHLDNIPVYLYSGLNNYDGFYDDRSEVPFIVLDPLSKNYNKTILHEVLHYVIGNAMRLAESNSNELTPSQAAGLNQLKDAVALAEKLNNKESKRLQDAKDRTANENDINEEFLVDTLSSLDQVDKTLADRIVGAIRTMLRLSPSSVEGKLIEAFYNLSGPSADIQSTEGKSVKFSHKSATAEVNKQEQQPELKVNLNVPLAEESVLPTLIDIPKAITIAFLKTGIASWYDVKDTNSKFYQYLRTSLNAFNGRGRMNTPADIINGATIISANDAIKKSDLVTNFALDLKEEANPHLETLGYVEVEGAHYLSALSLDLMYSDVMEAYQRNPGSFILTVEQEDAVNALVDLQRRNTEFARQYNITDEDGNDLDVTTPYMSRGREDVRSELAFTNHQESDVKLTKLKRTAFFENQRKYKTEADGYHAGSRYSHPITRLVDQYSDTLSVYLSKRFDGVTSTVGITDLDFKAQVEDSILEDEEEAGPYEESERKSIARKRFKELVKYRERKILNGNATFFDKETSARIEKAAGRNVKGTFRKGLDNIVYPIIITGKVLKFSIDIGGAWMIQNIPLVGEAIRGHPKPLIISITKVLPAFFKKKGIIEFVRDNPEYQESYNDIIDNGFNMHDASSENLIGKQRALSEKVSNLPILDRFSNVFLASSGIGLMLHYHGRKILTNKRRERKGQDQLTDKDKAVLIERFAAIHGRGKVEQAGIDSDQAILERILFYSASQARGYASSIAALFSFKNPLDQKTAWSLMYSHILGTIASVYAMAKLFSDDKEEEIQRKLDIREEDFLTFSYKGEDGFSRQITMAGGIPAILKVGSKVYNGRDLAESVSSLAKNRFSPLAALALGTSEDFEAIELNAFGKFSKLFMPAIFEQSDADWYRTLFAAGEEYPKSESSTEFKDYMISFLGLNGNRSSATKTIIQNNRNNSLKIHGKDYTKLTPDEKVQLTELSTEGLRTENPDKLKSTAEDVHVEFGPLARKAEREVTKLLSSDGKRLLLKIREAARMDSDNTLLPEVQKMPTLYNASSRGTKHPFIKEEFESVQKRFAERLESDMEKYSDRLFQYGEPFKIREKFHEIARRSLKMAYRDEGWKKK